MNLASTPKVHRPMPTILPALNLGVLLKNVPKGAWVAISRDRTKVVAWGADLQDVMTRAAIAGEQQPLVMKVPDTATALML